MHFSPFLPFLTKHLPCDAVLAAVNPLSCFRDGHMPPPLCSHSPSAWSHLPVRSIEEGMMYELRCLTDQWESLEKWREHDPPPTLASPLTHLCAGMPCWKQQPSALNVKSIPTEVEMWAVWTLKDSAVFTDVRLRYNNTEAFEPENPPPPELWHSIF